MSSPDIEKMDSGEEVKKCLPELETTNDAIDSRPLCNFDAIPSEETFQNEDVKVSSYQPPLNVPVSPAVVSNESPTECQEIDPVSSKSTSVSEMEEGQIIDSSSDASDFLSGDQPRRSLLKRSSSVLSDIDNGHPKKPKKKISFSAVTAYYFPRAQGFTCVPSQGGSTLGMSLKHSHEEILTISEHASQQRQKHRRLLMQLRKRRKNRGASKLEAEAVAAAAVCSSEATSSNVEATVNRSNDDGANKEEAKETDSDDSDADGQLSEISDSELDVDNYFFLQPVPTRQRRALLRESGVCKIETSEKDDCRQIRVSRESCGCSCQVYCDPESCFCAQSGIQCQVDRVNFPCGCSRDACGNPSGRVEFNPVRVRTHFIHTLMRLELENAQEPDKQGAQANQQQPGQQSSSIEELASSEVDGATASSSLVPPEPNYNWENVVPLASHSQSAQHHIEHQHHHSTYSVNENLNENGWFNHYSSEMSQSYSMYSANAGTSEVFSYEQATYDTMVYHDNDSAGQSVQHQHHLTQQYNEHIEAGSMQQNYGNHLIQGGSSEYYSEYEPNYQPFHQPSFSYHQGTGELYRPAAEAYSYADDSSTYLLDANGGCGGDSTADSILEAPTKVESSSNSSSEEEALDLGSSLATIVKETMVSV